MEEEDEAIPQQQQQQQQQQQDEGELGSRVWNRHTGNGQHGESESLLREGVTIGDRGGGRRALHSYL